MIVVFRGIAGSGKSYLSEYLSGDAVLRHDLVGTAINAYLGSLAEIISATIQTPGRLRRERFSADDLFMVNGEYRFDVARLSAAHGDCLCRFTQSLAIDPPDPSRQVLIVDNTNTTIAEVAPYAAMANAYEHELHVITLLADPMTAWRRNQHSVPLTNVVKQDLQLRESILQWPAWWPQQIFPVA